MNEVYRNDWFSVRKTHGYHIIDQKNGQSGCAVLPIDRFGNIVLVRQKRIALDATVWEAPRGYAEVGEDATHCARRELNEETGLHSEELDFVSLGCVSPDSGLLSTRVSLFAAISNNAFSGLRQIDSAEIAEVGIFSPAEQKSLIASNELVDGFTLSLLLKATYAGLLAF